MKKILKRLDEMIEKEVEIHGVEIIDIWIFYLLLMVFILIISFVKLLHCYS